MKYLPIFTIGIWLLLASCSLFDNEEREAVINPRLLTWEFDTLSVQGADYIEMQGLWGDSPNNVYTVGFADGYDGHMWHFDGNKWSMDTLSSSNGGDITVPFDLGDITGFDKDDIWVAGTRYPAQSATSSKLILHFDGDQWSVVDTPPGGQLFYIFGLSNNNIWAGGAYSTIMRYDGNTWESDAIEYPSSVNPPGYFSYIGSITGTKKNNLYSILNSGIDYSYLMHYDGAMWSAVDSFNISFMQEDLWVSPSGTIYYADNHGILKRIDGAWETVHECDCQFGAIYGFDDDNIIFAGYKYYEGMGGHAYVLHYDGTDWYQIPEFSDYKIWFNDIWSDGKEIFLIGKDMDINTTVVHGFIGNDE